MIRSCVRIIRLMVVVVVVRIRKLVYGRIFIAPFTIVSIMVTREQKPDQSDRKDYREDPNAIQVDFLLICDSSPIISHLPP